MIRDVLLLVFLVQVQGYVYPKNGHHSHHTQQKQHRPPRHSHPVMAKYYHVPKGAHSAAPKYLPPPQLWQNRGAPNHGRPGGGPQGPARAPYYGPPKTVVPRSPQPYIHKPPNFIPLSNHWKPPIPNFRPKESSFSGPPHPPQYHPQPQAQPHSSHSRYQDDERGPIRTIPAPNLNPSDKNSHHYSDYNAQAIPEVSPHIHAQNANLESFNGYQVTEDPSLHKPHSGQESYFAPDPDPHVPTLKVPPTNDPHSLPSNGKLPLDIALQQEVDQSNRLTAQELFNLMNGFHPGTNMVPQYIAPAPAFPQLYPAPAIIMPVVAQNLDLQSLEPQAMPSNFNPQMQTFNYDERTQQNAHGSDSFPEASSINMQQEMEKQSSQRANYFGKPETTGEKSRFFVEKPAQSGESDEGVASNQVDFEPTIRAAALKKAQKIEASLSSKHGAETLATLAQVQSLSSEEETESREEETKKTTPDSPPILDIVRGEVVQEEESEKPSAEVMEETRPVFNPSHYQNAYHTHYNEAELQKNASSEAAKSMRVTEMSYSSKINANAVKEPANHKPEFRAEESDSSSSEEDSGEVKEGREGGDSNMEIMEAADSGDGIKVVSLETSYSSSSSAGDKPFNSHSQLPYGARLRKDAR